MTRALRLAGLLALWSVVGCGSDGTHDDMDAGAGDGSADGAQDGSQDGADGAGDGTDGSADGADGTGGDGSDADAGIDAGANDGDAGSDDDAGTDGDDFPFPEERGFALGEDWLPLVPDTTGSGNSGGRYTTVSRGATMTRAATIYIDFREPPESGDYTVADSRVFAEIQPGTVVLRVNDARDMSTFWYADGTGGTVHVNRIDDETLDVVWKDVNLLRTVDSPIIPVGTTTTSASGWYTVAPH